MVFNRPHAIRMQFNECSRRFHYSVMNSTNFTLHYSQLLRFKPRSTALRTYIYPLSKYLIPMQKSIKQTSISCLRLLFASNIFLLTDDYIFNFNVFCVTLLIICLSVYIIAVFHQDQECMVCDKKKWQKTKKMLKAKRYFQNYF